jgi:hypothetical protein
MSFLDSLLAIYLQTARRSQNHQRWKFLLKELDDGWTESEKAVFQAALRMVVVKDSRWIVGEFYIWAMERYGVKSKIDYEEDTW